MTMAIVPGWMEPLAPLLLRACATGVVLVDAHGRVLRASPVVTQALAGAGVDAQGLHWDALWAPGAVSTARHALAEAMAGRTGHFRAPTLTPEGRWAPAEVSVLRLPDTLLPPAVAAALLRDVSEVARLEQALAEARASADFYASLEAHRLAERAQALEARQGAETALAELNRRKDEFLATLAHELRNPLAPIRTATELLQLHQGDPAITERALGILGRQVTHLVRLVDDLVDINRISRGEVELRPAPVELAAVVETALEISRPLLDQARHTVTVDVPATGLLVRGDRARLAQALSNLLNNAAKYTPTGGSVTVRGAAQWDQVVLSVTDTGAGIPADKLEEVFELFTRVKTPAIGATDGLGIGLALVRRLVALHGGTVRAHSPGVGRGTTIEMRLPLVPVAASEAAPVAATAPAATSAAVPETAPASAAAGAPASSRPPLRILLVDDNIDAAVSQGVLLELRHHQVRVAHTGHDALEAARDFAPQVALLDLRLPDTTGHALASALRALPGGNRLVCIAQTGWEEPVDRAQQTAAGFAAYLVKPVDWGTLDRLLESVARTVYPPAPAPAAGS
jgi:signal transduction histidine kinase/ActR/RegA family two-component response regulator